MHGSGWRPSLAAVVAAVIVAGCGGAASSPGGSTGPADSGPSGVASPATSFASPWASGPAPSGPAGSAPATSVPADSPAPTGPCVTRLVVEPSPAPAEPVRLTDVRVESVGGADRIAFVFAGDAVPAFEIAPAGPPFTQDASGLPVAVPGASFLRVRFPFATGMETYAGPTALDGPEGQDGILVSLVRTGDFEAVMTWVAGTSAPACARVSTLSSPTRLVLDLAPAG